MPDVAEPATNESGNQHIPGVCIAIEGLASNKPAILRELETKLARYAGQVQLFGQASGKTAEIVERLATDTQYSVNNQTEVLLYDALLALNSTAVQQARAAGDICLIDTTFLTQLAIQYYGLGLIKDYAQLHGFINFATHGFTPDLTIVLDTPAALLPEDTIHKLASRHQLTADTGFIERVRAGYLWEAQQRAYPVVHVTAETNSTEEIWKYIAPLVQNRPLQSSTKAASSIGEVLAGRQLTSIPDTPSKPLAAREANYTDENSTRFTASYVLTPLCSRNTAPDFLTEHYETKDQQGHFRYMVPASLKGKSRSAYIRTMNQLFSHYIDMLPQVRAYLESRSETPKAKRDTAWREQIDMQARLVLQPILPLAATTSVSITEAQAQAVAAKLAASELAEALELRNHMAKVFDLPLKTDVEASNTLRGLSEDLLPNTFANNAQPVDLVSYTPRNELDTAADALYTQANISLKELRVAAAEWPYQRRADVIRAYIGTKPPEASSLSALQAVRYEFDLCTSYLTMLDVSRIQQVTAWQTISPRLGYRTPETIEEAGLNDAYDACFDLSLQLYSELQAHYPIEAPYSALLGHNVRYQFICTLGDMWQLVQGAPNSESSEIITRMINHAAEVHPLLIDQLQLLPPEQIS